MVIIIGPKETIKKDFLRQINDLPEKIYMLELKNYYKSRTLNQNSLFHALCQLIARETGMDPSLIKEGIKEQYGVRVDVTIGDHKVEVVKPSHQCDTAEMARLIDGVMYEAAELGIDTTEYHVGVETIRRGGAVEPRSGGGV